MSKKKILKAILLALSVLLTAAQSTDGKEEPAKFNAISDFATHHPARHRR